MYNYRRSLYIKYERGQVEPKNGDTAAMEEVERRKDRIEKKGGKEVRKYERKDRKLKVESRSGKSKKKRGSLKIINETI